MDAPARCRELGEQMRRRREASGRTAADVARWTDWSASKISRAESGKVLLSEVDLIHYLAACRIFVKDAKDLLELRRDAEHRPGYWMRPHQSLQSLVYHEAEASESVTYEPQVVCGLLQTEDYATAIVESMNDPAIDTECAVRIRLDRQRVVTGRHSARFTFFLHEHALQLPVGSPATMRDQLLHLLFLTSSGAARVRVVPAKIGERSVFGGPFRLLRFTGHQPLVYLDNHRTGLFVEEPAYVRNYEQLVPEMTAVALDEHQSRALIGDLANEFDRHTAAAHGEAPPPSSRPNVP
jgi:transcriptional regulator with XRE-family HTH domain